MSMEKLKTSNSERGSENNYEKIEKILKQNSILLISSLYPKEFEEILKPLKLPPETVSVSFYIGGQNIDYEQLEKIDGAKKRKRVEGEINKAIDIFLKQKTTEEIYIRIKEMISNLISEKANPIRICQTAKFLLPETEVTDVTKKVYSERIAYLKNKGEKSKNINDDVEKLLILDFVRRLDQDELIELFKLGVKCKLNLTISLMEDLFDENKIQFIIPTEIYSVIRPRVRETITEILNRGEIVRARLLAQRYEKNGFLDIEKDEDLFDKLTKPRQ